VTVRLAAPVIPTRMLRRSWYVAAGQPRIVYRCSAKIRGAERPRRGGVGKQSGDGRSRKYRGGEKHAHFDLCRGASGAWRHMLLRGQMLNVRSFKMFPECASRSAGALCGEPGV
jgi:hypothetical protein